MTASELGVTVAAARATWNRLRALMASYGLDIAQVPQMDRCPLEVTYAYKAWAHGMNDVATALAALDGIASAEELDEETRIALTARAWALVMAPGGTL